jgi:type VI protein secretion system component VasF
MTNDKLLDLLTDIRDQQKRQMDNFEQAIAVQSKAVELQRKWRQTFVFMVFAPWAALALMIAYSVASMHLI